MRNSKPDGAIKSLVDRPLEPASPIKAERHLFVHVEDTVKLGKPRLAVQRLGGHAQPLEVVENVGLNTLQTGLGGFDAVRVNAERSGTWS